MTGILNILLLSFYDRKAAKARRKIYRNFYFLAFIVLHITVLSYSPELPCFYSICWGLVLNWARQTSLTPTMNSVQPSWGALSQYHARHEREREQERAHQTDMTSGWFTIFDPLHRGWKQSKT